MNKNINKILNVNERKKKYFCKQIKSGMNMHEMRC